MPLRKEQFETTSGIEIGRVYSEKESPGEFPFTRGIYPEMYRSRLWTMRQYAGFGSAAESNKRYKYLLASGTTGLSIAFDLPTQIGYDSDHPMASGEVGRVGVAIDSLEDFDVLFDGIEMAKVSTSMTINATASILLALYVAKAKKQGAELRKLSGTVQNDILKEYAARGTYIYPPTPSMRIVTDLFRWCAEELPTWNTISISGYHIREAGATAVEEIAFTLSNGIAYVQAALDAGLDVDRFAPRLSFFFNAHSNFFEEIAKFRAARTLWAEIMRDRFHAKSQESMKLRFHSQTAGSTLTAQQIENNVVRTTIEAMAAVLGGTQSLHTNGKDEALALPTESSARTALRTQQIIAYESGIADTVDPMAGSYYVEYLTSELRRRSLELIGEIDAVGGAVRAIEHGFYQDQIARSAYEWQKKVESKQEIVVGVNEFVTEELNPPDVLRIDPNLEHEQAERVQALRAKRNQAATDRAIAAVEQAARSGENLMPLIISAVEAFATLGEISDTMRRVFGEYHE
ncbi:MAG: methylmalonyl-CoA mutase family protein [Bacteroidota bacterium]|nr:methylmalonyl-CoA mutase family protein [Bacteroidota bacterium]MDP4234589.1 methylmalonyl-CoA mutase family protein [Bacteroidota bacterium]MDP4243718.1 methylmalonyl-CoA mutase family protein [Bacteroidota bacterium]MDP4288334.1 methylmalonyl-CoA mutase family protein [Bacteroidota bacterium]